MTQEEFFKRFQYNIRTDKLGGGAFGTVYKAYDNVLDKEIAIKVSEVKTMGGKEFSLMDEFKAIENLPPHPNVANYETIYTFETFQGIYDYALIQYYPHGNLKDYISQGDLSLENKDKIARQLLSGLAFLHNNRVVHRDMKPSNILIHIRKVGGVEDIIPKIADFGLSKKADPSAQSRFTNSFGGGTLEYSSPEQLRGQNLRFNTDLWAYGVIVYELFTSKPLFIPKNQSTGSAEREKEIFDLILNGDMESQLNTLPENWKNAVAACLIKKPEDRVKSAEDLFDILDPKANTQQAQVSDKTIIAPVDDKTVIAEVKPEPLKVEQPKEEKKVVVETPKRVIPEEKPVQSPKPQAEDNSIRSNDQPKKKSPIGIIAAVLIIAILVGGGLWYFLGNKQAVPANPEIVTDSSKLKIDSLAVNDSAKLKTTTEGEEIQDEGWKITYSTTKEKMDKAFSEKKYASVVSLGNQLLGYLPEEAKTEKTIAQNMINRATKIMKTEKAAEETQPEYIAGTNIPINATNNADYWDQIYAPIGNNMVIVKKNGLRGTANSTSYNQRIPPQYVMVREINGEIVAQYENGDSDYYDLNGIKK